MDAPVAALKVSRLPLRFIADPKESGPAVVFQVCGALRLMMLLMVCKSASLLVIPPAPMVMPLPPMVKRLTPAVLLKVSELMFQAASTFGVRRVVPPKKTLAVPLLAGGVEPTQLAMVLQLSLAPAPFQVWANTPCAATSRIEMKNARLMNDMFSPPTAQREQGSQTSEND